MKEEVLIPAETLAPLTAAVRARIAAELPDVAMEPDELHDMLAWALMFGHWPQMLPGPPIGADAAFYNHYFWLRRFATRKQKRDGYDAGLEQYVYQALESAEIDVDFDLVGKLDTEAGAG